MKHSTRLAFSCWLLAALAGGAKLAAAELPFVVSGQIASSSDYHLHVVPLSRGGVVATLVCDAAQAGGRPLDPALSVFFPGNPHTSDTLRADVFNDDGFGSDDDTAGVDCDNFDSARATFYAPVDGDYTFRVDGFGTSTGPYTLTVGEPTSPVQVPALSGAGPLALTLLLAAASLLLLRRRSAG